jgi:hypothetical protein
VAERVSELKYDESVVEDGGAADISREVVS